MKVLLLILLLTAPYLQAQPLAELKMVGQGEMNWMFWKLYDAQLYSATGQYSEREYPMALALTYARDIDRQHLIEATIKEWKRLDLTWDASWLEALEKIWPSVKSGDQLLCLVDGQGYADFYLNNQHLGRVPDANFGKTFLAIWLSPATRDSTLRSQLIGDRNA